MVTISGIEKVITYSGENITGSIIRAHNEEVGKLCVKSWGTAGTSACYANYMVVKMCLQGWARKFLYSVITNVSQIYFGKCWPYKYTISYKKRKRNIYVVCYALILIYFQFTQFHGLLE